MVVVGLNGGDEQWLLSKDDGAEVWVKKTQGLLATTLRRC